MFSIKMEQLEQKYERIMETLIVQLQNADFTKCQKTMWINFLVYINDLNEDVHNLLCSLNI